MVVKKTSNKKKIKNDRSECKKKYKIMKPIMEIKPINCKGPYTKSHGLIKKKHEKLLDLNDLFCVIAKYKPIADITIVKRHRNNKYKKLVNQILDLANECKIKIIITKIDTSGGVNMVVFHNKNLSRALIMAYISKNSDIIFEGEWYLIGKLLGYLDKNIKAFYINMGECYNRIFSTKSFKKKDLIKKYNKDKQNHNKNIKKITNSTDFKKFKKIYIKKVKDIPADIDTILKLGKK